MYSCTIQALILYSMGTTLLQKASSAFALTPLGYYLQLYKPVLKCDAAAISVGYKNINYF